MKLTLLFISLFILAFVVFQDFKSKSISWYLLPMLLIVFIGNALLRIEVENLLLFSGINLILVITNLVGVFLLVWLKEKKPINIIDSYLGLGDVLFFLVITTTFSPFNFVVFYLGSILIITLIYGVVILINKEKKTLIPLAGAMSLLLMFVLIADAFIPSVDIYNDIFTT